MSQVQFSHNPLFCIDIIKTYKPDFTPRVAFILGSGPARWPIRLRTLSQFPTKSCRASR